MPADRVWEGTARPLSTLLCDADGTLFPSEEPAFEASAQVVNGCLAHWGVQLTLTPDELRSSANGRSFRSAITELARQHGVAVDTEPFLSELEGWVRQENASVTQRLADELTLDPQVRRPLARLASRYRLAVVSSSSLNRVAVSLDSAQLADLFPADHRFSAQDSLEVPTSKPDPAVYRLAGGQLGVGPGEAIAVEDAVVGAESAIGAGFATVGMLCFVPPAEVARRAADLRDVGVSSVVSSWSELERLLTGSVAGLTTVAR